MDSVVFLKQFSLLIEKNHWFTTNNITEYVKSATFPLYLNLKSSIKITLSQFLLLNQLMDKNYSCRRNDDGGCVLAVCLV